MWERVSTQNNPSEFPDHGEFSYITFLFRRQKEGSGDYEYHKFLREYNAFTREIKWRELFSDPSAYTQEAERVLESLDRPKPEVWPKPREGEKFTKGG